MTAEFTDVGQHGSGPGALLTYRLLMRNKRMVWAVAAIAVVLVLTGAGIAVALASRSGSPPAAAPASTPSAVPTSASPPPPAGADIKGPLNLLILGVDTRVSDPGWEPHSDAIMLLHLDESLESGYLFSLPRDLRVQIPAFPKARFPGGRYKITEAMSYGSRVPGGGKPNPEQGYALLKQTISNYTGIKTFDAGAVLTFTGLSRLTDALGGVTLKIDQKVVSQHRRPDGTLRTMRRGGGGYVGPQATYLPGTRTLKGWQAIDYARQRYTDGGDYTRQRHQRQLVKALLTKSEDAGLATDTAKLQQVISALGQTLIYSGRRDAVEFAYALRNLAPEKLTLVGLPGASVTSGGGYLGEALQPLGRDFLKAVVANEPAAFLAKHPALINK
jgi:polyisoprenyl-teichoic acid--peptidoglycan teichoic acid transferase